MTDKVHMPLAQAAIVSRSGELLPAWVKFLRSLVDSVNTERTTGRVSCFELSAGDLADDTKFVQAGATEGLGVGDYLGWAYCNGNNGTTDRVAEFAAFTTLVPLMRV